MIDYGIHAALAAGVSLLGIAWMGTVGYLVFKRTAHLDPVRQRAYIVGALSLSLGIYVLLLITLTTTLY